MHNGDQYDEEPRDATGWSAFLVGALIGAGVALLFAPQPGTELRGRLRDYTNRAKEDVMDKGQEAWDSVVDRGKEFYEKGEELVRDAGRLAKDSPTQTPDVAHEAGR